MTTTTKVRKADAIAPRSGGRKRRGVRRRSVVLDGMEFPVDGRPLPAATLRRLGQLGRRSPVLRSGDDGFDRFLPDGPVVSTVLAAAHRVDLPAEIVEALTASAEDGLPGAAALPAGEIEWTSPALMFTDTPTGDGRDFAADGTTHRDLPLPMLANLTLPSFGHDGAGISGRIESISLGAGAVPGSGLFADTDFARTVAYHVWAGNLRGISVDLAISAYEIEYIEDDDGWIVDYVFHGVEQQIMGATWTPHPAFADAHGTVADDLVETGDDEDDDEVEVVLASGVRIPRRRTFLAAAGGYATVADERDLGAGVDGNGGATPAPDFAGLVAAGRTTPRAPREWLSPLDLEPETPFLVDEPDSSADDLRRVYGHFGIFPEAAEALGVDACHVGIPDACVCTPRSQVSYSRFVVGDHLTAEGERIPVGAITLSGGHAADSGRETDAEIVAHYDDTDRQSCHVAVYEDDFGPYVAGYVRPEIDADAILTIRASALSGHWRSYRGSLELLRICHVNTPGFTIVRASAAGDGYVLDDLPETPRVRLDESGSVLDLVAAAGTRRLAERKAELLELDRLASTPLSALDALRLSADLAGLRSEIGRIDRRTRHVEPGARDAALARIAGE